MKHYRPQQPDQYSALPVHQGLQSKRSRGFRCRAPLLSTVMLIPAPPRYPGVLSRCFDMTLEDAIPVSMMSDPVSPLFTNRLSHFLSPWSDITTDYWVLSMVEVGYVLQVISPSSHPPSPYLFRNPCHEKLLVQKVQSFLWVGAVEEVMQNLRGKEFYSRYFLIPKAKGGLRPVLHLCHLNSYLKKINFHVVTSYGRLVTIFYGGLQVGRHAGDPM